MREDRNRLQDILLAISQIEKYFLQGREAFEANELIQVWMVYQLQIIGEASRSLSEPIRSRYPDIPWAQIIAMRNILVHEYFGISWTEVWVAVERDIPILKPKIETVLQSFS